MRNIIQVILILALLVVALVLAKIDHALAKMCGAVILTYSVIISTHFTKQLRDRHKNKRL